MENRIGYERGFAAALPEELCFFGAGLSFAFAAAGALPLALAGGFGFVFVGLASSLAALFAGASAHAFGARCRAAQGRR